MRCGGRCEANGACVNKLGVTVMGFGVERLSVPAAVAEGRR